MPTQLLLISCSSINVPLENIAFLWRKSEQAHTPHAPTLLNNAVHNEWKCHALVMGNWTENHN